MDIEKTIVVTAVSTIASEAAVAEYPELRPLAGIAQVLSIILLVGSFLLLAEKGQLRR